jgi:predicted peptidase
MLANHRRLAAFTFFALVNAQPMLAQNAATSAIDSQDAAPQPTEVFEARVFKSADGAALPYRLLKPLDYDARQKYPLVLFLHGAGERGDDNERQLVHGGRNFADPAMRRRHPAFIVVPQCAEEKKWVEVPWDAKEHKAPAEAGPTMKQVFALLDALQKEFSVDANRIYGVGLSMGGYGTWDILQRKPQLYAAAIPICGGGDVAYADRFKDTPVWVFHGEADPAVPVSRSRDMVKALKAAGGKPIYTEYEGVGHDSWTQTFDNRLAWEWLFAQHK